VKGVVLYGNTVLSRMVLQDAAAGGHAGPPFVAVAVDAEYRTGGTFCGLPELSPEQALARFPAGEHGLLAVLGGYRSIRSRETFFVRARALGYPLVSYVSPRAAVSPDATLGANCVVMEFAYVGPRSRLGDDVLVRQHAYLGHDLTVGAHCVFGPGCRVGGHGSVGDRCYVCMGATGIDSLTLGEETLVGAGAVVIRNTEPFSSNVGNPSRVIGTHMEEGIRMEADHG